MKANKALEIYRDRDAIEKVFRMEKSYLGCDVFRVHSIEHLESKDYTVPKVLRQYERIGLTKLSDDRYHIRYNLTKKQKQVIGIYGLKESDYKAFAKEIKEQIE